MKIKLAPGLALSFLLMATTSSGGTHTSRGSTSSALAPVMPSPKPLSLLLQPVLGAQTPAPMALSSVPQLSADGAIENQPAFRQATKHAWDSSQRDAMRKKPTEAGFTVFNNGQLTAITQHTGGINPDSAGGLAQTWYTNTLAALHTHPPVGIANPRPSQDDINIAKRQGKPVMVVSRDGLFEIDAQGNVRQVFKGTDWMNKK